MANKCLDIDMNWVEIEILRRNFPPANLVTFPERRIMELLASSHDLLGRFSAAICRRPCGW
jgi:hypothetical protein